MMATGRGFSSYAVRYMYVYMYSTVQYKGKAEPVVAGLGRGSSDESI